MLRQGFAFFNGVGGGVTWAAVQSRQHVVGRWLQPFTWFKVHFLEHRSQHVSDDSYVRDGNSIQASRIYNYLYAARPRFLLDVTTAMGCVQVHDVYGVFRCFRYGNGSSTIVPDFHWGGFKVIRTFREGM